MIIVQSLVAVHGSASALKLLGYIDPGTGSLVFQAIAASIISGALFVRSVRDRIIWLITGGWRAKHQAESTVLSGAGNSSNDAAPNETSRKAA